MSEIEIKRIVSFSSEDKVHKAENLLIPGTYKRWNCATPGEKNAIVVLQFEKATEIHSIDIQNDGSAFIEVLVRRSTDRLSNYQVLLVASSFMSPIESQAGIFTNRVQMFGPDKLAQNLKDEKWDYVKVVCTQPFNKSTSYGLTYIKFYSPSEKLEEQPKKPETKTGIICKRKHNENDEDLAELPTKRPSPTFQTNEENIAVQQVDKKMPFNQIMCKVNFVLSGFVNPLKSELRSKALEMGAKYTEEWNSSCTHLVCAFANTPKHAQVHSAGGKIINKKWILDCYKERTLLPSEEYELGEGEEESSDVASESEEKTVTVAGKTIKRETSKYIVQKMNKKKHFNQIMSKVLFALSGFANPLRSKLRNKALKMGAKYRRDWNSSCTHLVCAFVNTPKYVKVQSAGGKIVTKKWILDCYKKKALLPWEKYELGEDEEESSDITSESEEESVAVSWKSIKRETSKYSDSKNDPANILNASLVIKQEIETEDEDPVQNCMAETNVQTNSGMVTEMKFIGSKSDPENIPNASFVMKKEIKDEDVVQDCMAELNVQTNSGLRMKSKFRGFKDGPANIVNASLVIKEEIETEDEDAVQDCMADANVPSNSGVIREMKFIGITKEERKIMKNVDEDKSSNWSFSNLSSKHDPVHNFNSSVAIKEEIETEDEDAVQDYMANTNTEINSVIKKMKFTGS